ncbi:hypothetical protein [Streptomyces jeddahensis]|uniref:Uncharacterized protein n=1 Tax=Streptomyces jeddahensis TaxID=1716141 RepID=A0A177HFX2_9ACTN|nr:hypothetical protein [Streptomyces jeddahensis]OAH09865.1 hypothetical protein STSP_68640 [Streptomyces jeddahensis]
MLVLGLLLVLATSAFTAVAVVDNFSGTPDYPVEIAGNQIATLNASGLFLSGVVLALIFCLGLALLSAGVKSERRMRASLFSAARQGGAGASSAPDQPAPRRRRRHIFGH